MSNPKPDPQPSPTAPLPDVAMVGRQYGMLLREAIQPLVKMEMEKLGGELREWLTGQMQDMVWREVHARLENAIADHMSNGHPLGELHSQVDASVSMRLQQLSRLFGTWQGVETLLRAADDVDNFIDERHAAYRAQRTEELASRIDAEIDQELQSGETEDEATA